MFKLYNDDCLKVMDQLINKGTKVDAIITDPPYNMTKNKWDVSIPFPEMWSRFYKLIKPNGAMVIFGAEPFASALRMSNIKDYKYDWYWDKVRGVGHLNAKKQPMRCIETISVFYQKPCTYNPQMRDREKPRKSCNHATQKCYGKTQDTYEGEILDKKYPINLLTYSKSDMQKNNLHPTQKPQELIDYLVKTYTNEGDVILDICMGSGPVGISCQNFNRSFIGIELDQEIFINTLKRFSK